MKILIIGLYYSNNLGDAILCDCTEALLRKNFPDAETEICDFLDRRSFAAAKEVTLEDQRFEQRHYRMRSMASRFTPWDKEYLNECRQLRKNIDYINARCQEDYDLVVFAGGQIFMDYLGLYVQAFTVRFAKKNTPVQFNACGTGPGSSPGVRKALSLALNDPHVKWISCRDGTEYVNKKLLTGGKRAFDTFDSAVWCSDVYGVGRRSRECSDPGVGGQSGQHLGLGLMYANSLAEVKQTAFWIRIIRKLERRHVSWKFFTNGSGKDQGYARYVLGKIPELTRPFEEYALPIPENQEDLVRMISSFDSILSMRLHSHIIAESLGIPSVAVVWDQKLRSFFQKAGHPERCCTVNMSPETVMARLDCAQKEGIDEALTDHQKQEAERLLVQAVDHVLS